jgi:ABC-type uncharacterized transport system substrate-binding protein
VIYGAPPDPTGRAKGTVMKRLALFALLCLFAQAGCPEALGETPSRPPQAGEEKTWRLAIVYSGPFKDYQLIFQGMLNGMEEQGLIENGAVPLNGQTDMDSMWAWAAAHAGGSRLAFVKDALYSYEWDREKRESVKQRLLDRIRDKGDIDCILTFGTWPGQDFAAEDLALPVLVSSVSDAVGAGIIPSPEDSGRDNLWAAVEPGRYELQLRVFHEIFPFSRLGIAYDDTPSGRGIIALPVIEKAAENMGIELVRCTGGLLVADADLAADRLLACHRELAERKADAVYITYTTAMAPRRIPEILAPLIDARIPTFSQVGSEDVAHGALLSIAQTNMPDEGRFSARALAEVLRGKKPRSLSQVYESSVSLAVNLRTAMRIGWNLPMEILSAVDQLYQDF